MHNFIQNLSTKVSVGQNSLETGRHTSTFCQAGFLVCANSSLACFDVQNVPDDGIVLGAELLVDPLDVLDGDLLDGWDNVVLGAEVDALLGLNHPPDHGAGDALLVEHERGLHHLMGAKKLRSGGRWYAPKCVTPGVSAGSHRSSISISHIVESTRIEPFSPRIM